MKLARSFTIALSLLYCCFSFGQHTNDSLDKIVNNASNDKERLEILDEIIVERLTSHDISKARPYIDKMYQLAKKLNDTINLIDAYGKYLYIAETEQRYADAIDTFYITLELAKGINYNQRYAQVNIGLAACLDMIGRSEEARKHLRDAIAILKSLDGSRHTYLAVAYNSLGVSYDTDELYEDALKSFNTALYYIGETDPLFKAAIWAGMGNTMRDQGKNIEAMHKFDEALVLAGEETDYFLTSFIFSEMGLVLIGLDTIPDELLLIIEKYGGTLEILEKGYSYASENHNKQSLMYSAEALSKLYAKEGNYEKAYDYNLEYQELFKQQFDSTQLKTYADLETKYNKAEQDKQLAENELVISKAKQERYWLYLGLLILVLVVVSTIIVNRNIKRAKRKTEAQKTLAERAVEEKEILLREVHHRVKNNLQVISSLLNKQAQKSTSETVKQLMSEGQNRIKSMAMIHQSLYQTEDFRNINIRDYTEELTKSIAVSYNTDETKVTLDLDMPESNFHIDVAIPLGLILNELLTNVYKYAFKGRQTGQIMIALQKIGESSYQMRVKDDGIGLPADIEQRSKQSLGLNLVKGLCWQLNGDFNYETNNGSTFNVNFKDISKLK